MNEKALQILEQYDLEVLRSYGGRGGIMLETKDGLKMIKEFAGSRAKLPLEQRVLGILAERGVCAVDQVQANKEGELVTIGDYETPYIIKDWPPGRECDPKNEEELLKSMRLLARVHRELRGVLRTEGAERRRILGADRSEELEKHNREMKRARNFIRTRQKKGEFELLYLQCAETIFQNGADALELLKASGSEKLYQQAVDGEHLCHGEYVHHNILLQRQETALVNFSRFEINVQMNDVSQFLRKIMEKHNWNGGLAERMLTAYERERPLSGEERAYLAASLCYPEKAWKLVHHYYHTNKAWVPEKSAEKLQVFLAQNERRKKMVKELWVS
ncbi:phosphotransferase [Laedolimicola intestinihominis]|uniref:Phosphotransferase n=1 Tax=Laedolimicola intestinihominis TaxID=3133166 RepID=A0ABV1FJ78_9FIRM|nr:MarR family transcriptional regulator [Lachnospiraceae bacterium]